MNGASISTPIPRSVSCSPSSPTATSSTGASESSPAIGSASSPTTAPSRATTSPPPSSCARAAHKRHVVVVHADDDEVVRVVRDGRGERAGVQAEAAHEPEPDAPRRVMALDHRDLGEVGVADPADAGAGDQLPGLDLDHAHPVRAPTRSETGTERIVSRRSPPTPAVGGSRPSLSTSDAEKSTRSSSRTRSAT